MNPARLVLPALRWHRDSGFAHEAAAVDAALEAGVGGFCIFGGTAGAVRDLTGDLRRRSAQPLLIASDLERGAGQQFGGATRLPPLAALGSLDDTDVTRRAAAITAAEARSVGVNWVYAPVADVNLEQRNPIVGTRAFGSDPHLVARHVDAWVRGCRDAGVLCCAKHFPGHGRTTEDSHAALPRVRHGRDDMEADLLPFRAAIAAGVDAMMSAHVVYDALDPTTAATLSHPVLHGLARGELGFRGIIVSDALNMAGALEAGGGSEGAAAVAALLAGCDALLYPDEPLAVVHALRSAAARPDVLERVREAAARLDAALASLPVAHADAADTATNAAWAGEVALRTMVTCRGTPRVEAVTAVATIDDDLGGPFPAPARTDFTDELQRGGIRVAEAGAGGHTIIALYSDIRAWKGAPGLTPRGRDDLERALAAHPDATVILFGHPALARDLPGRNILGAWGGEALMQRAAARWLTHRAGA
jgi:beta-glucosidase-like glycosyl hydrolase